MKLHLLHLEGWPIFEQLQLEEALLRADQRNWCLLNSHSSPAIVMGISGKADLLIDRAFYLQKPLPLIRRFSGGGTVVVDENTLFVTFILNKKDTGISNCPRKVMEWTGEIYRSSLPELDFQIRENDYTLGDKKFGGNAQYMQKDRWLHHTSLLWDYDPQKMDYLLYPPKTPAYREKRPHTDFLCKLCHHLSHKEELILRLKNVLTQSFEMQCIKEKEVKEILNLPHRKATTYCHIFNFLENS
jgi:lipoate-protein ligase A